MKINKQSPLYTVGFIIALSIVFGFGISFVHFSTLAMLKEKEALHKNKIIAEAFMLKISGDSALAYENTVNRDIERLNIGTDGKILEVYKDKTNGNVGFLFTGTGFWDKITGIIVLSPDLSEIVNIAFLEQHETPGLGARIEEKWFTGQFHNLQINWSDADKIIIGPSAQPDARNRVDAITGATQTSIALMNALNLELADFRKAYEKK